MKSFDGKGVMSIISLRDEILNKSKSDMGYRSFRILNISIKV